MWFIHELNEPVTVGNYANEQTIDLAQVPDAFVNRTHSCRIFNRDCLRTTHA